MIVCLSDSLTDGNRAVAIVAVCVASDHETSTINYFRTLMVKFGNIRTNTYVHQTSM